MYLKVRKFFAKYRVGAGLNSPVSGILFYGQKIKTTNRVKLDGTIWFEFLKNGKPVWIDIEDLELCW